LAKVLTPAQFSADLRKQIRAFAPAKRRRFMRKVAGKVMENMVIIRFLRGGYRVKGDWKTASKRGKFQDRWSEPYWVRPTKNIVSPDKIRNVDTRTMGNNHKILSATPNSVTVGPSTTVRNPVNGALISKIAEREEKIGNHIVGFTDEINTAMTYEMQNYLDLVANGKEPPYLPKSRIGRKRVKV